jgi:hypothetical protein
MNAQISLLKMQNINGCLWNIRLHGIRRREDTTDTNRGTSIGQVAMKPINITRRKPTIV